jgi:hypothetical protein
MISASFALTGSRPSPVPIVAAVLAEVQLPGLLVPQPVVGQLHVREVDRLAVPALAVQERQEQGGAPARSATSARSTGDGIPPSTP